MVLLNRSLGWVDFGYSSALVPWGSAFGGWRDFLGDVLSLLWLWDRVTR